MCSLPEVIQYTKMVPVHVKKTLRDFKEDKVIIIHCSSLFLIVIHCYSLLGLECQSG